MLSKQTLQSDKLFIGHQIGDRMDSVYDHCLMMIATGKWAAGSRIPSVREAGSAWGVNRVAVHEAFKKLASQGILTSKPGSGYYVTTQENINRISNHRVELENLFRTFLDTITQTTKLAPLPVFRYLAKLAHIRDKEAPMCAFAECTLTQATIHAEEVINRLGVSVLPMTVNEISGKRNRIPRNVSVLLTTHFHLAELVPLHGKEELEVVAIPVEVSKELVTLVRHHNRAILLLEKEQETAGIVAEDAGRILQRQPLEIRISKKIHMSLSEILESHGSQYEPETLVFVSPYEWNSMDSEWRDHPNVNLMPFQICEEGWSLIAEVVGMPLGTLG